MAKFYTRKIRIGSKLVKSPRFSRKTDADNWYEKRKREKTMLSQGLNFVADDAVSLNEYFDHSWLPKRKLKYPASTWTSDSQRFDKYVRNEIGHFKTSKINNLQIRHTLEKIVDVHEMSIQTRNKVRSLLSKIFNDAMLEKPPVRTDNPALAIRFNDPRQGKKVPNYIGSKKDIVKLLKTSKEFGLTEYLVVSIFLMTGIRKSELIGLQWRDFDFDSNILTVSRRLIQAEKAVVDGTKAGSNESREIAIPDALISELKKIRKKLDYQGDYDFVISEKDGSYMDPRKLARMLEEVSKGSGVKISPHGLRHTYGREFVINGGPLKALQSFLGHSNSAVTVIYSKLAGKHLSKNKNVVSYDVSDDEEEGS